MNTRYLYEFFGFTPDSYTAPPASVHKNTQKHPLQICKKCPPGLSGWTLSIALGYSPSRWKDEDLLSPTNLLPVNAGALEEGHTVVVQTLLHELVLRTIDERNQHCKLSQVLLLNLVASQVAFLVVSNELHLCNHLIDLIGTGFLGLTTHVELLGSLGSIRGGWSKTGGGCVVILRGHGLVELANSTGVELSINAYGLQLLNQGLTDSLGGGILTEDGELEGSLLAVLLVELTVLGVACIFQNLGCSSSIVVRGRGRCPGSTR